MNEFESDIALIPYFAEVIAAEGITDKVRELRFTALQQLRQNLDYYKSRGFVPKLLYGIADKKGEMLIKAMTHVEVERILTPRCPRYDGNRFIPGKYHVPEEELICWSEASSRTPLNMAGCKRFEELFQAVFPEWSEEILGAGEVKY